MRFYTKFVIALLYAFCYNKNDIENAKSRDEYMAFESGWITNKEDKEYVVSVLNADFELDSAWWIVDKEHNIFFLSKNEWMLDSHIQGELYVNGSLIKVEASKEIEKGEIDNEIRIHYFVTKAERSFLEEKKLSDKQVKEIIRQIMVAMSYQCKEYMVTEVTVKFDILLERPIKMELDQTYDRKKIDNLFFVGCMIVFVISIIYCELKFDAVPYDRVLHKTVLLWALVIYAAFFGVIMFISKIIVFFMNREKHNFLPRDKVYDSLLLASGSMVVINEVIASTYQESWIKDGGWLSMLLGIGISTIGLIYYCYCREKREEIQMKMKKDKLDSKDDNRISLSKLYDVGAYLVITTMIVISEYWSYTHNMALQGDACDENVIIFKGTTSAYEWIDNGIGGYSVETEKQRRALDFVENLDIVNNKSFVVSGHSKGGNHAQYVTLHSKNTLIDRCLNFDGQDGKYYLI